MIRLSRYNRVTMHGIGLSYSPLKLRIDPWWQDINGVWWTTRRFVYFFTFRRETRHWG